MSTRRKALAIFLTVIGIAGLSGAGAIQLRGFRIADAAPESPDFVLDEDQARMECIRTMGPELGSIEGIVDIDMIDITGQPNDYRLAGSILQDTTPEAATTGHWACWVRYSDRDGLRTSIRLDT